MKESFVMMLLAVGFVLVGCKSSDDDPMTEVDCAKAPKYSEVAIFTKCATCHSSKVSGTQRNGAPTDVNFDTFAAADAKASKASQEVMSGSMPPKGASVTVTTAEKDQLYQWVSCGSNE